MAGKTTSAERRTLRQKSLGALMQNPGKEMDTHEIAKLAGISKDMVSNLGRLLPGMAGENPRLTLRKDGNINLYTFEKCFNDILKTPTEDTVGTVPAIADNPIQLNPALSRVVLVKFVENTYEKEYAYRCEFEVSPGDWLVVCVNKVYKCVQVTRVRGLSDSERSKASKWIVCKVDTARYEERMKRMEVVQEIRNKLKERKEQMQEFLIYKQLAETDPEIKKLLDEYNSMMGND